ncbi:MAG: DUF1957 domain-containing protein [Aphanocapsa feldmannii 277cV]|uniref:DUF1957 domain-containing protein n=1 Tax=Aphanocapsa feldmannii 277cV TaxID=2507553 RepID=A0A524RPG0_9CHRO|nr:MAG: DUF1957 domain-containing protein [Aphanocapsa feldmannii 277cV]
MTAGRLALVLHGHLPFVRSLRPGSLEEDWFHQALLECYLPLLAMLQGLASSEDVQPRLTMSLSPTLLAMLDDPLLQERFPAWLALRLHLLEGAPSACAAAVNHLGERIEAMADFWESLDRRPVLAFAALQQAGVLDLITCSATHGYLPLLREPHQSVRGQLHTAVVAHGRQLGCRPQGIWLPECAYFEGLDAELAAVGLRYAVLDGHGLLHALPRPRYGVYAPICSPGAVAFFARDSASTLPVWSARDGYPGHGDYREFHRDLGWDMPLEDLQEVGIDDARPLGLKLHRVTDSACGLAEKEPYDPSRATARADEHGRNFVADRLTQAERLARAMHRDPLIVAPFDAELFGHWWFEGPRFLEAVFRAGASEGLTFTTLRQCLEGQPRLQVCRPAPSSWGQGGFHTYWLSESNAWMTAEWDRAGRAMLTLMDRFGEGQGQRRLLQQAARELLLAQSSDWSFILRAGTTTDLARQRLDRHLSRFWRIRDHLEGLQNLPPGWLHTVEHEDNVFPDIDLSPWQPSPSRIS